MIENFWSSRLLFDPFMFKAMRKFFSVSYCFIGFYLAMQSWHADAAIIFPKMADQYRDIAYRETVRVYSGSNFFRPKYLQMDQLNVTMGHKYYWLDHRLGSSNTLFSLAVTSPGWNYMLRYGTNMAGVMELVPDHSNHWVFGGAIFRGQPDPIWVGLERANDLPQVKSKDYEFRFLTLSGTDYPIIWLHGDSDDILVPLSSGYGKWEAYKPYSEQEIISLLKPEADGQLRH
jgi:hypothetical protein